MVDKPLLTPVQVRALADRMIVFVRVFGEFMASGEQNGMRVVNNMMRRSDLPTGAKEFCENFIKARINIKENPQKSMLDHFKDWMVKHGFDPEE